MPYSTPPDKIKALPEHAQKIWMAAFNAAWKEYNGDEEKVNATAWAAVKQVYEQDQDGKWVKKSASKAKAEKMEKPAKIIGEDLATFISLSSSGDVWSGQPGWGQAPANMPPEWIRVLPLGEVTLNDDRKPFMVTADSIKKVMDKFASNKVDMVIDYEHQTMSGEKAPAAGWVKELKQRDDGLWAYVQWTPAANEHIVKKEYRYYSPTVRLDENRVVQELLHIGLTNFPAISGIPPLTLKKEKTTAGGNEGMLLEKLTSVLGLGEGSIDVDVVMAVRDLLDAKKNNDETQQKVTELSTKVEKLTVELTDAELRAAQAENIMTKVAVPLTVTEALGIKKESTVHETVLRIEGLKTAMERTKELEEKLAALKGEQVASTAEKLIQEALSTGRVSPAELEKNDGKLKKMAENDPEFFKEYIIDGRPAYHMVPLEKLPKDIKANIPTSPTGLSAKEEEMFERAGVTMEVFKEQLEREKKGNDFLSW